MRRALVAAALAGGAAMAAGDQITVKKEQVRVLEDKGDAYDTVETVGQGAKLEVLDRDGKWLHVRTEGGKEGYVYEDALKGAQGLDLSGVTGPSDASITDATAAIKPMDKEVEAYAHSRNLDRSGLLRMQQMRKKVTGKDFVKFARDGKVGAAKYR